jgi:FixJ family two-component response regulator
MNSPMRIIAVIDDDFRVLESLQNLLASFGYQAETYVSGESFLASDRLSHSSCIIADLQMPKMNALQLLQQLRSSSCEVPMIVITGRPSAHAETFYLNKGARGFFRKPVDGPALVTLIDRLLAQAEPSIAVSP